MRNAGPGTIVEQVHDGSGRRIAMLYTRWNDEIVNEMRSAARDILQQQGVADGDLTEIAVPGAYELPLACKLAAKSGRFDGVIAIGCVIRGETPHFDYVAGPAAYGISAASVETSVPVIFGVLTVNSTDQAWQRAARDKDNKGAEFALAALEMISVKFQLTGEIHG